MTSNRKKRKRAHRHKAKEQERANADSDSYQGVISPGCDAVGPPDQSREPCVELAEPCLEPKHKIFLSHSGAQKAFTERLCERLEAVQHFAFFDKRADSLRKGERFYPPLMKAAKECRVAVLVLSNDFFTSSKWPMMELKEFYVAQAEDNPGLMILPLFFKITRKEFYKLRKSGTKWEAVWKGFKEDDDSIDAAQWKHALSRIPGYNGLQYGGETEGESEFIKKVVAAVCRLLRPDVRWDVSHFQRVEQLCEPILKKLKEVEPSDRYKVPVVGLYGMGGVGKSTISRAVCNQVFGEFAGNVCHVELGSRAPIELLKSVLRELTEASPEILVDEELKLVYLLKQRMHRQRVFLVLDNVWDKDKGIEEVQTYLNAGYSDGSMVLVTARSAEVLSSRLHIGEPSCMEMPMLDEDGATDVFLQYSGLVRASVKDEEWEIVRKCVKVCCFEMEVESKMVGYLRLYEKQSCYHPLALKALGIEVGSVGVWRMGECLGKVAANKVIMLKDKAHGVFSVLKLGFDALCEEEQLLFLDLALVWSAKWTQGIFGYWYSGFKWLRTIYRIDTTADMDQMMKALQSKGLLQRVADLDGLDYSIHDLYLEFAEVEARSGALEGRCFLIDRKERSEVPHELKKYPPNGLCWPYLIRLVIYNNYVQSLKEAKLHLCKNLEVLDLDRCENLEELDVTGMENLRCVVVSHCGQLRRWKGLENLSDLAILCWTGPQGPFKNSIAREFLQALLSLTALEVLTLKDLSWSEIDAFPPNLSGCIKLRKLTISSFGSLHLPPRSAADIGESLPKSLIEIDFSWCPVVCVKDSHTIRAMSSLKNLRSLNLELCPVKDLTGLGELICLEWLNVSQTWICMLPDDLWKLKQLRFLDVSGCWNLKSLAGLAHATALQRLDAWGCDSLEELSPGDFIGLKQLQHLDVRACRKLTSIAGIVHATALRRVDASWCGNLTRLPEEFSGLEKLEMLELTEDSNIRELPKDYKWLAGHAGSEGISRVRVRGCWGLIEGLLERLRGPEMSRLVKCNECEPMQAWTDGMKNVNGAAYYWLTEILSEDKYVDYFWKYRLDDDEARHVVTRALCEHFTRGTLDAELLAEVTHRGRRYGKYHWVVVATAPSTFAAVTKKAALEPWNQTLLHYTIERILADYIGVKEWRAMFCTYMGPGRSESEDVEGKVDVIDLGSLKAVEEPYTVDALRELVKPFTKSEILPEHDDNEVEDSDEDGDDDNEARDNDEDGNYISKRRSWLRKAIVAVFQKCKEKLEEAGMLGTDCMRSKGGRKVVDTFLTAIEAATGEGLTKDSILWRQDDHPLEMLSSERRTIQKVARDSEQETEQDSETYVPDSS